MIDYTKLKQARVNKSYRQEQKITKVCLFMKTEKILQHIYQYEKQFEGLQHP